MMRQAPDLRSGGVGAVSGRGAHAGRLAGSEDGPRCRTRRRARHAMRWAAMALVIGAVASCASIRQLRTGGIAADELPFRASVSRGEGRAFTVVVQDRGAPLDAFRESVRFHATRHCVRRFGGSEVAWRRAPAGDWLPVREGDRLRFAGRCMAR